MTVVLFPMKTALHSRGTIVSNQCLSRRLTSTAVKSPITIQRTVTVSVIFSALSQVLVHIQYNITSAALDDIVCSTSRMLLKIHTYTLTCLTRLLSSPRSQVRDSDSPDLSAQERYSAALWNLERRLRQRDPPSGADKAAPISGAFLNWEMIGQRSPAAQPATGSEHGNLQIPRRANLKHGVSHRRIRLRVRA